MIRLFPLYGLRDRLQAPGVVDDRLVVTPQKLASYRRHIVVGLLVAAAILTPPDPLTQVMLALPLYLLFEVSMIAARLGYRRKQR